VPGEVLQALYGVTPAEAALAVALAGGQSAEEIARERDVRLTTVRTQIRQLLAKTDAKNLRDLVRLLTTLASVRPAHSRA
jgi:DNA-binding NarL/FixJ family response regulator